jgi:hypothetical protein
VLTPQARGRALARRLEQMSPAAQRLFTERSRWWPGPGGQVGFRIEAPPDDADALRELIDVLCAGFNLDLEDGDADDEPDFVDGDGLTFDEFQQLLHWRRGISTSLR